MIIKPGDIVRLDFPGHGQHGQRVVVVEIDPAFNLAPDGAEPWLAEIIFVKHPSWAEPVGVGRAILGGTVENARLRAEARPDDAQQGEMVL